MRRDFRTAYLNALGFKGGSQLKTSLEAIFEHRVIGKFFMFILITLHTHTPTPMDYINIVFNRFR